MGAILGSRMKDDGKVVFEVSVDYEESKQLRGHMDNVHIFCENAAEVKTNISQRGKNESTKYFLIPRELRPDLRFDGKTTCQRIETRTKTIFVFVVDKLGL